MDQFQVGGWQNIDASVTPNRGDRMPDAREHNKFPAWNQSIESHVYKTVCQLIEIEIDIFGPIIISIIEDNDNYLTSITKPNNTTARFNMRAGNHLDLDLSSFNIAFPGNTKVLFDDNSTLGGNDNFLYDKITNSLKLSNFNFTGRDTVRGQSSYNTFMQYVGTRSLLLNSHYNKYNQLISTDNFTDNIGVGSSSLLTGKNLSNVTAIGKYSASELDNVTGGVYLGNYAGSKETEGRRFYIDDESFNSKSVGRASSLLYGEFDNDYLQINAKTYIKEEVRIGDFTRGTASGGMVRFIDTDGTFAPWYHDGTEWRAWDTGANYYLDEIIPGTVLDYNESSEVTFHVNGFGDLTLQLGLNAFTDTPPKNAHGEISRIQLSTGTNANPSLDHNFISYSALEFDTVNNILNVGRGLKLPPLADVAALHVEGTFFTGTNNHAYVWLNGAARQIDNGTTTASTGDNIGNSFEVYAQQSDADPNVLEFRTLTAGTNMALEYVESAGRQAGAITISNTYSYLLEISPNVEGDISVFKYPAVTRTDNNDVLNVRKFKSTDGTVTFSIADDGFVDFSANDGGEIVPTDADNIGGGAVEWYSGKDNPTLHFKTLDGSTFIDFTEESDLITANLINALVVVDNIGANGLSIIDSYGLIESGIGINNYKMDLSRLYGLNGIVVAQAEGRELTISNTIPIPSYEFTGTTYNAETKLLNWKANYDSDIRNGVSYTAVEIGGFKIGTNLTYDSGTNTLSADDQTASGGDILVNITNSIVYNDEGYSTIDTGNSTHEVVFEFESGYALPTNIFGYLAFQDIYQDADINNKGIVRIGDNINVNAGEISVAIASTDNLGLVQVGNGLSITEGGVLSATGIVQDAVLFNWDQYSLHDDDSFNSGEIPLPQGGTDPYTRAQRIARRVKARGNIGAAYVNGLLTEDFNTKVLTAATKVYCTTTSTNEDSADVSRLQNILFRGTHITTTSTNSGVYMSKRASVSNEYTSVGVLNGDINILINGAAGSGRINIYKSNSGNAGGSVTKMFSFDAENGDLFVKRHIRCGGTFEAFDTDIDTLLG